MGPTKEEHGAHYKVEILLKKKIKPFTLTSQMRQTSSLPGGCSTANEELEDM